MFSLPVAMREQTDAQRPAPPSDSSNKVFAAERDRPRSTVLVWSSMRATEAQIERARRCLSNESVKTERRRSYNE
ncbi:hypothetical protein SAMN05216573_1178 [Bradyrhizobium sp. Rc3b]|uniref:hypothetical protein n=1 Tax=Bradyrhizobium sp. Rc3b TaxID=1855322 RepID=UPI0008E9277A|nr:hypothetical protein [Bradyrhizobium sp. Rc3b]SFN62018.1 hypothetical protein SAMN05216573_1178 [Bradyrhizobium sp. Rc3b]